jgi:hypothetical protein
MSHLLLRFCLLGSFIGGGVFVAARDIAMSTDSTPYAASTLMNVVGIPLWAVLTSFLSIPIGFVPATLAALLYWQVLVRITSTNPRPVARAAIGGTLGCTAAVIFGGLFFAVGSGPGGYPVAVNLLSWAAAGLVGGAVSAVAAGNGTHALLFTSRQAASGA